MDLPKILGRNVRRLREGLGASQEEVAFKAGLNRAYLSDVERGERNPTVRVVGRLAKALAVEPMELFRLQADRSGRKGQV
ncbi:MAG TPA: helix-turn-helix transcriptional regulator [Rhizomicrobium sp.]